MWLRSELRLRRQLRALVRLRQLRLQEKDRLLHGLLRRLRPDVLGSLRRRLVWLQRRNLLERMAQRSAAVLRSLQPLWPMGRSAVGRRGVWLWRRLQQLRQLRRRPEWLWVQWRLRQHVRR